MSQTMEKLGKKLDAFLGELGEIGEEIMEDMRPVVEEFRKDFQRELNKASGAAPEPSVPADEDLGQTIEAVLSEIGTEVIRGKNMWGDLDKDNSVADYVAAVTKYLGIAVEAASPLSDEVYDKEASEDALRKAAGLLTTAIVMSKKNGRLAKRHWE